MKNKIHPKYFDLIEDKDIEIFSQCVDWQDVTRKKVSATDRWVGREFEESFIERWGNYLHWRHIASQGLREEFIEKYIDKLWDYLAFAYVTNEIHFSDEFFIKYWNRAKNTIGPPYASSVYWMAAFQRVCEKAKSLGLEE